MSTVPSVKVSQPHIEQIHTHLELALIAISEIKMHAEITAHDDLLKAANEASYEVTSAKSSLPPSQLAFPF